MTAPLPERIGRFRVVGFLGQGAMGVVYRGRDDVLERDVALKLMAAAVLGDLESRQRFLREARASARLQHPNIVTIYELGEHEGQPFMALELLEGLDLQRALEQGMRPDPKLILPVVLQMLAGLGHAHAHGVVHRDVKPSNVFIPHGRPVKIMDFGVARVAATNLTTTGHVVGTPSYMSPEQVRGVALDGRSDLFSVGLILYELLTGEKAFRADSVVALLYRIAHETPDLSLLPRRDEWAPLRAVLERVLARDPAARYADAGAMSQDLLRALVALGGTTDWTQAPDLSLLTLGTPRPRATVGGTRGPAPAAAPPEPILLAPPPAAPAATERELTPTVVEDRARPAVARQRRLALVGAALALGLLVATLVRLSTRGRPDVVPAPAGETVAPRATPSLPPALRDASVPPRASASPRAPVASPLPAPAQATPVQATPSAPPAPAAPADAGTATPRATAGDTTGVEARVERAERLLEQGRYASALSEARAVLARAPDNDAARDIVQEAEALLVVETSLKNARAAWQRGDRESARGELQKGLALRPNDARLLALWREITR